MTEENALIASDALTTPGAYETEENAGLITTSSSFLARVMLMQGLSKQVTERKAQAGDFCFIDGDNVTNLNEEFNCLVLAWRPKAMQFAPDVLSFYDPKDPEFEKIQEKCDTEKDYSGGYGPEYLLWLPDLDKFAAYFCSNATERREAPNFKARLLNHACVASHLIEGKKHSWYGPQVSACVTPFDVPNREDNPDWYANMETVVQKFKNPPVNEVETAEEDDRDV